MAWDAARRAEPLESGWAGAMGTVRCHAEAQALADRANGEAEEAMQQLRSHCRDRYHSWANDGEWTQ